MSTVVRVQDVALPLIRTAIPSLTCGSWLPDIDFRSLPLLTMRRIGGGRDPAAYRIIDVSLIEMMIIDDTDPPSVERLYADVLDVLFDAALHQKGTAAGYIHSIRETSGASVLESGFPDTFRVQGVLRVSTRPVRS